VTARLASHDPAWAERFRTEAAAIRRALGELVIDVEHVGSTAVPGLAAKPTIDIAVGATTLDVPGEAVETFRGLGYEDVGEDSRPWERRFRKGAGVPYAVIVHIVEWGGPAWTDFVRFRDALRSDVALAAEYEALKRSLLDQRGEWYRGVDKRSLIERALTAAPGSAFVVSGSAEQTEGLAGRLAERLAPGDLVVVSGELGSGKTTFVRGACRALGVVQPVTSPTFTIGHRYRGRVDVSHLDLFRFAGLSPAEWGDLEPYFEDAIAFVEWPEAGEGALPAPRVAVTLGHVDPSRRAIRLDAAEPALLIGLTSADPGVRHGN
jgi:tRNA threonylcarbamoyladenosine biosynthesis protein TsaE